MSSSPAKQDADAKAQEIRIEVIEEKDVPKVLEMLKEFFFLVSVVF